MGKTLWYRLEIPTGTKEAARLRQRGSLKGTGWFFQPVPMGAKGTGWVTRYSRTERSRFVGAGWKTGIRPSSTGT